MKRKPIVLVSFLFLAMLIFNSVSNSQEKLTFTGTYDGHEDYGYNFIGINEEKEEYTMTFQKIDEGLLETFNLKSETLVNTKFMVTYTTKIVKQKDEDGYDDEIEVNTIVGLKKL